MSRDQEIDPEEEARLTALQKEMMKKVDTTVKVDHVRYVAGCDATVEGDLVIGGFVVVDLENDLNPVYQKCSRVSVSMPYVTGFLAFREGPAVLECLRQCREERPDLKIDVLLVDGSGEWHKRKFGLACYVGLECGLPTVGVYKGFLVVEPGQSRKEVQARAQVECPNLNDVIVMEHEVPDAGKVRLAVMRTTTSEHFNPIYISPGHLIDLESSVALVRKLCKFREPEPLRLADRLSRQEVRNIKKQAQSNE